MLFIFTAAGGLDPEWGAAAPPPPPPPQQTASPVIDEGGTW